MHRSRWIAVAVVLLGLATLVEFTFAYLGVGAFKFTLAIETTRPITRVRTHDIHLTGHPDLMQRIEEEQDPNRFEYLDEATADGDNRYTTFVFCETRTSPLRLAHNDFWHPSHLVVFIDFADGTHVCRVIDLPEGRSKGPITVRVE
jgi:hypothetical protein